MTGVQTCALPISHYLFEILEQCTVDYDIPNIFLDLQHNKMPELLLANPFQIILLTLALMLVKGGVLFILARVFGLKGHNRWLFTLGLAQAGEFGFVLTSFTVAQRILPDSTAQTLLLVIALSMLLTPLFFLAHDILVRRLIEGTEPTPRR